MQSINLYNAYSHSVACSLNLSVPDSEEKWKYLTISQQWETVRKGQLCDEVILHWD